MAMAASSCLSLASTAHAHLSAGGEQISSVAPWPKLTSSRLYIPNACSIELSYSSSSALAPVLSMNKKKLFRLTASSTVTQEGMPMATEEETEEEIGEEMGGGEGLSEAESGQEEEEEKEGEETQVEESPPGTKVYVGNLPFSCDSAELAGIVQQYGSAEMVEVIYDRNTGRSRGFGFVTMSTVEDANAVVENLDGSEYLGRYLRVNYPGKQRPDRGIRAAKAPEVFVANLSWDVNAEILCEVFRECGNPLGAKVIYDDTGKSRGFGFVSYASEAEVEAAVASLNGMEVDGRPIRLEAANRQRNR